MDVISSVWSRSLMFSFFVMFVDAVIENNLRLHLFQNYTADIHPVHSPFETINVTFNMKLMQVLTVDERRQKITSQAYYSMSWRNEFLQWNPEDWGGIKQLSVHPDHVWIPDIILKNNADSDAVSIQKDTDNVWVHYSGKNSWYPKVMLTSSFDADVRDYPFDRQVFSFNFLSWSLGQDVLRIFIDDKPIIAKYFINSTEWELLDMHKGIVTSPYDSDEYCEVQFSYTFARKPSYCILSVILPCIMLMVIALFSYLLPPHHGERIGVLTTSLLAFTFFIVEINSSLPRNSDSVPVIKIFYMVTICECILCFLSTCLVIRLYDQGNKGYLPFYVPKFVKKHLQQMKKGNLRRSIGGDSSFKQKRQQSQRGRIFPNINNVDVDELSSLEYVDEKMESKMKLCRQTALDESRMMKRPMRTSITDSVNFVAKEKSTDDCYMVASKLIERESSDSEKVWNTFAEYLDNLCLHTFSLLFLITSTIVLIPPFVRWCN